MTKIELSALLEVLSFMFVTIDLYGKQRIEKTNTRLILILDKINQSLNSFNNLSWSNSRTQKMMRALYVLSGALSLLWYWYLQYSAEDNETFSPFFLIILAPASLFFILMFIVLVLVSILVSTWILKSTSSILVNALRIVNFEGLLLMLGSIMFFVSKYLGL